MYYRLWKELYKELLEHDPENEVICLMNILERKEETEAIIESLLNDLKK